jgi:hypothetical protein
VRTQAATNVLFVADPARQLPAHDDGVVDDHHPDRFSDDGRGTRGGDGGIHGN